MEEHTHTHCPMKQELMARAIGRFGTIFPCGSKSSFDDCFFIDENHLVFWFDTHDNSTHLVRRPIE